MAINILKPGEQIVSREVKDKIQHWQITNDSATGLGIEYRGHEVDSVNVGGMVLYHTNDMKPGENWVTGIIRRFTHLGRSHLSMGIQRLPPNAHTGKLFSLNDEDQLNVAILMYPENPLLNSQATIIAPPGTFNPAAEFQIALDNGREFCIRAIKTVQINPVLEQFTFEYIND